MNHAPKAPPWPAFLCDDGWAWHPDEDLRHCHEGVVHAPRETVATFYEGPAVERVLALRSMLLAAPSQHTLLCKVLPDCEQCWPSALRLSQFRGIWRRAAMSIHDGAVEAVREARPGLEWLWNVNVPARKATLSERYKTIRERGIPVRDETWDRRSPPKSDATLNAQLFWAAGIIDRRETKRGRKGRAA